MFELLSATFSGIPYLVALSLGLVLPLLGVLAYSRFGFGAALVAICFAADVVMMSQPFVRVSILVYAPDAPMVLLAIVAATRWLLHPNVPRQSKAWLIYIAIFFIDLVIGLARHGTAAGVQARMDFYAIACASYAMTFEPSADRQRALLRGLGWLAVALVVVCGYRWVVFYGNLRELLPPMGTYNEDGDIRVVGSAAALIIAQVAIVGTLHAKAAGYAGGLIRLLVPVFGLVVLALQHRSVWLAALVGLGAGMVLSRSRGDGRLRDAAVLGLLAVALTVPLLFGGRLADSVESSAARALQGGGTVQARFENWRATLDEWRSGGVRDILTGREAGASTLRTVRSETGERRRIAFGAHNNYVSQLTGTGVFGFLALMWTIGYTMVHLMRRVRGRTLAASDAAMMTTLMVMQLVYYVAYSADFVQALLFGWALTVARGVPDPQPRAGAGPGGAARPARVATGAPR